MSPKVPPSQDSSFHPTSDDPISPILGMAHDWQRFGRDHHGYSMAAIGGVVALFSFFVLPYADFVIVSVTGVEAAGLGEFELWLIPLTALILIGVPTWRWRTPTPPPMADRKASIAVLTAGGVATLALVDGLVNAGESVGLLGAGFWLPLVANLVAGVGGWLEYRKQSRG